MDASKKQYKRGKFLAYISFGSFILAAAACVCFLPIPNAPMIVKTLICTVGYVAWDAAYTIVNVPYGAMLSNITAVPGGYALSGYTNSTNRDFALKNSGESDSFVYIITAYGDLQTVSSFGGSASDNARGICSNGKTVYICGYTNSGNGSFANASVKGSDGKGAAFVYQYNLETT